MKLAAADCAIYAACAEDMHRNDAALAPDLDERMAGWRIVGYITALNALFGAQIIGAGDRVYYGFLAQNNADLNSYAIVVRGTASLMEWLQNARFVPFPTREGAREAGFYSIYRSAEFEGEKAAKGLAAVIPDDATVTVI